MLFVDDWFVGVLSDLPRNDANGRREANDSVLSFLGLDATLRSGKFNQPDVVRVDVHFVRFVSYHDGSF